ncbi:MAG: hypothetical protein WBI44_06805 [Syntrophaceticus sp.]
MLPAQKRENYQRLDQLFYSWLTREGLIEVFGGCPSVYHHRKDVLKSGEQFPSQKASSGETA